MDSLNDKAIKITTKLKHYMSLEITSEAQAVSVQSCFQKIALIIFQELY